jgi:hypothetical protein
MAKRHRLGEWEIGFVEMQVGSADASGGNRDNRSVTAGKSWVGTGLDPDAAGPIDNYGAHIGVLAFFVAQRICDQLGSRTAAQHPLSFPDERIIGDVHE